MPRINDWFIHEKQRLSWQLIGWIFNLAASALGTDEKWGRNMMGGTVTLVQTLFCTIHNLGGGGSISRS